MGTANHLEKFKHYYSVAAAFIFISIPVLFPGKHAMTGILSCLGVFLFMTSVRMAHSKKQYALSITLLWIALSVRFSCIFGYNISSFFFILACFLPVCIILGVSEQLEHKLQKYGHRIFSILVFPLIYTAICIMVVKAGLGNIVNLANPVFCISPISYNLRWAGEYVLSFFIMLIISLLSYSLAFYSSENIKVFLFSGIFMILALLVTGSVLSSKKRSPDYSLNVALATGVEMDFLGNSKREYTYDERLELFRLALEKAHSENADLLVLNEEFLEVDKKNEQHALDFCSREIKMHGIPVLVCLDVVTDEGEMNENRAVFFDENGKIIENYLKNNLVPVMEANEYLKGEDGPVAFVQKIDGHDVNVAVGICYDINNSFFLRQIPDDTELLLMPSWDWDTCNIEQKRAYLKSIEFNTTILKHTYEGFSYASGPYGITDMIDFRKSYDTVKMIKVPVWEK